MILNKARVRAGNDNLHCPWRRFKNMPCPTFTYLVTYHDLPNIPAKAESLVGIAKFLGYRVFSDSRMLGYKVRYWRVIRHSPRMFVGARSQRSRETEYVI